MVWTHQDREVKRRLPAAAMIVVCAGAMRAAPCAAQNAPEDPTTVVARARFKEGVDYYDRGEFEQARTSFLQAYALKKHPAVLINLAWSSLKAGRPLEAERYFKQFLAEGKEISEKQRADALDGLSQTRGKLGHIEVTAPAGAEVFVDGERMGIAPIAEAVAVEPGAHTVRVRAGGGAVETQSVSVLAGEKGVARFDGGSSGAGIPPVTPAPAAPPLPPLAPLPAVETPAPPVSSRDVSSSPESRSVETPTAPVGAQTSFFPNNMTPVFVGGSIALASTGVALAMIVMRQSAQDNATTTYNNLTAAYGTLHYQGQAGCPPPPAGPRLPQAAQSQLSAGCNTLSQDNSLVNTDATIGNIATGVAVASFVGTVIYWIAADKTPRHSTAQATLLPIAGPRYGGMSLAIGF